MSHMCKNTAAGLAARRSMPQNSLQWRQASATKMTDIVGALKEHYCDVLRCALVAALCKMSNMNIYDICLDTYVGFPAGNRFLLTSARLSAPDPKTRPSHIRPTPEPHPNHVRTTSEPRPNHVRTTSKPHPKQWQKLREKWFLAIFPIYVFVWSLLRDGPTTTTTNFEFISRGPIFSFLGYPRMTHQMPLLHSGTQRNHKDFSSDGPSTAVLVWHQMQNFFGRLPPPPPPPKRLPN